MTTDRGPSALRLVGAKRFERFLVVIVAVFGVLYTAQSADSLVAHWASNLGSPLGVAVTVLTLASVLIAFATVGAPSRAPLLFRLALGVFTVAILLWPFSIHAQIPVSPMPWLVAIWPCEAVYVAVATTGLVRPLVVSIATAFYLCVILGAVGHLVLGDVFSSGFFMAAASAVLLLLVRSVRHGVARADAAQDAALAEFGRTRLDVATETERTRTDALVHDSVITTLLTAATARTPDAEDLTSRMAQNALRVLAHVNRTAEMGPGSPFRMAFTDASEELRYLLPHFEILRPLDDGLVLPTTANEALIGAMIEAMVNSVEHAGPCRRTIDFSLLGVDGIRIVVADDGAGFDVKSAVASRLGVRVSIIERLRRVDGRADVVSTRGGGTTVTLSWGSAVISGTAPLANDECGAVHA